MAIIKIAIRAIGDDTDIELDQASTLLSTREQDRADSFHFARDRDRYIRGRALLRSLAGSLSDTVPSELLIETEEKGKPFFKNLDLAFNLSHSADLAFFAFSETPLSIGADIELLDRTIDIDGLSKHYFTQNEQRQLQRLSSSDQRRLFFRIWTAKEARMKIYGDGLHLPPDSIDVEFEHQIPTGFRKPAPDDLPLLSLDFTDRNAVAAVTADQPFTTQTF